VRLNLDLSSKLVLHPSFEQLLLLEDLDGHDVARPLLPRQVHGPELPSAKGAADLEVGHGPVLPLPRRVPDAARAAAATGAAVPIGAAAVAAAAAVTPAGASLPRLLELDALRLRRGIVVVVVVVVAPNTLRPTLGGGTAAVALWVSLSGSSVSA